MRWLRLTKQPGQRILEPHYKTVRWQIREGKVLHQGRILRTADPETMEILDDDETFIARDCRHVYHAWSKLAKVDRLSFEALGDRYFRDSNSAYCEHETSLKPLKGGDPKSFKVLGNGYARDTQYGYYWGRAMAKCEDPKSLKTLKGKEEILGCYAIDSQRVYFEGAELKDANVAKWRQAEGGFSLDDRHVWFGSKRLAAQAESWKTIDGVYSHDARAVFYMQWKLPKAVPDSFRLLKGGYSTDGERVYWGTTLAKGADAATFKVTGNRLGRDKHSKYDCGIRE